MVKRIKRKKRPTKNGQAGQPKTVKSDSENRIEFACTEGEFWMLKFLESEEQRIGEKIQPEVNKLQQLNESRKKAFAKICSRLNVPFPKEGDPIHYFIEGQKDNDPDLTQADEKKAAATMKKVVKNAKDKQRTRKNKSEIKAAINE